jgi:hypothetical protein
MTQFKIRTRRDIAAIWTSVNPIMREGEEGLETDTKKYKVGDGVTAWNSLAYWTDGGSSVARPHIKTVTGTTYTLVTSDENGILLFTDAAGCVITLPPTVAALIVDGWLTHVHQEGNGILQLVAGAGVTTRAAIGLKTRTQYASLSIIAIAADTYKIIGDAQP